MEAQINDIATSASQVLLNPFLLAAPVVGLLVLATGLAGRIALFVEDYMYDQTLAQSDATTFEAAPRTNGPGSSGAGPTPQSRRKTCNHQET